MTSGKKPGDMLNALRMSAEGALARLTGARREPAADAATADYAAFRDPTVAFMPGDRAGFDGAGGESGFSLSYRLTEAAADIDRRIRLVYERAAALQTRSAARANGEKSLTIWGWRFMIGLFWLLVAYMLSLAGLNARANGVAITSFGVPLGDVAPLVQLFTFIGLVAAGVAAMMAASVMMAGNATNAKLREEARRFGDALADESRRLAAKLDDHRQVIKSGGRSALAEVSRAHLTALGAAHYFRSISFLTTANPQAADEGFSRFFNGFGGRAAGFAFTDLILVGLFGALCGLAAGKKIYGGEAVALEISPLAIAQYPQLAWSVLIGAGIYLVIGVAIDLAAGRIGRHVMAKARDEALDAVRSAYLGAGAPLADDMARQVEDFVQILQARLGAAGNSAVHGAGEPDPDPATSQFAGEPSWRRRDSSVRLVETGFSAAPDPFRTDAFSKKFEAPKAPEPAAKRRLDSLKKPSRD